MEGEDSAKEEGLQLVDETLHGTLEKYGAWLTEERIPAAGRVIPVQKEITAAEWILPTHQAADMLHNSDLFALADCVCRVRYGRCDGPVETCLVLDDIAEQYLDEGKARRLTLEEAVRILEKARDAGLIHLTYYRPQNRAWVLCSCCSCCCVHLQLLRRMPPGHRRWILKSDYVITHSAVECVRCGRCVTACSFGCLQMQDEGIVARAQMCFGCGHCVGVCPSGHLRLRRRGSSARHRGS